jgi:hypothetical protein
MAVEKLKVCREKKLFSKLLRGSFSSYYGLLRKKAG